MDAPKGKVIHNSSIDIEAVYFPVSGMISLVANLDDGAQAEVGIIGREGMLGMSLLSGYNKPYVEAIVPMHATLLELPVRTFRREIAADGPLRELLTRYCEAMQAQLMQTAACNGRHPLEQRLARWLLMAHDRVVGDTVHLSQEFLAMMLGVLRPTVSIAAAELQREKLIRYAAGHITMLDRAGLEGASCACYAAVQARFEALLGKVEAPKRELVSSVSSGVVRNPCSGLSAPSRRSASAPAPSGRRFRAASPSGRQAAGPAEQVSDQTGSSG